MTLTSTEQPTVTASAHRLTSAVALLGGVRGALRSGLIEALWRWQPCTAAEIATRAHLPERSVELTLAALAVGGVTVDDGADRWVLTAPPEAWALIVGFEEDICRFVETGAVTRADGEGRYTGVLPVIGRFHERVAELVAPLLARPHARVLELAAGTAPWSRAILSIDPTVTAVAVDLPPVIAQLDRSLRNTALAGRIDLLAQDVRRLALAERFDVVVVSGLCRLLEGADNARLFERCVDLLTPDGRLVICDAFAGSADHAGALALYALGLAARSRAETLWSADDYKRWLTAAGFTTAELVLTEGVGVSVLVASATQQADLLDPSSPSLDNSRNDNSGTNTKDHS